MDLRVWEARILVSWPNRSVQVLIFLLSFFLLREVGPKMLVKDDLPSTPHSIAQSQVIIGYVQDLLYHRYQKRSTNNALFLLTEDQQGRVA